MSTEVSFCWHQPDEAPFVLSGFAWYAQDHCYRRLPVSPSHTLPPAVDDLANHTAGGQIRFRTDSTRVTLRVQLTNPPNMDHMPATGQCGFDCYLGAPGEQRYYRTTRVSLGEDHYESALCEFSTPVMRDITLNFPLYCGVKSVEVGLAPDAQVLPPQPYADIRPVIYYGTSITHGGCAMRPGMAYPNILSRRIHQPMINLGFSGSGRGEPEVAEVIAEIADPACIVLDYDANTPSAEYLAETMPEFIRILRAQHPVTPILVISRIGFSYDLAADEPHVERLRRRDAQQGVVEICRAQGDANIHFLDGGTLLGDDFDECTVDGVHPTDLGFLRMANAIEPVLRMLLTTKVQA